MANKVILSREKDLNLFPRYSLTDVERRELVYGTYASMIDDHAVLMFNDGKSTLAFGVMDTAFPPTPDTVERARQRLQDKIRGYAKTYAEINGLDLVDQTTLPERQEATGSLSTLAARRRLEHRRYMDQLRQHT